MKKEQVVTEELGVVCVNNRDTYNVLMCSNCGACVTITLKQRYEGTSWRPYLDDQMDCCDSPRYFYGDWKGKYS